MNLLKSDSKRLARLVAGLALLTALVVQCIGAWTDSQTTDEGAHLAAGISYWRTNDFRLNPEHPALVKLLAAAPLTGWHQLQPTADSVFWEERDQWSIGRMLLYQQLTPPRETQVAIFLARVPIMLMWLGLGLIVWRWAEERTSAWGGTVAVGLYAFDPTFLGHGHLVTTDVAVAAGMTASLWLAAKMAAQPRWRTVWWFAIIFSATQLTKFSALVLWPLIFGLLAIAVIAMKSAWTWPWWRRTLLTTIAVSAIMTWAVYGFELRPANTDPRIAQLWVERDALADSAELATMPPLIQKITGVTAPGSPLREQLESFSRIPIPAYGYWRGVFALTSHNFWGHTAYLLGEQNSQGWWYYFPVAIAVKTPLPVLGLTLAVIILGWVRRRQIFQPRNFLMLAPILVYLIWSLFSRINIGVRHVLPIFPLLYIGIASLVPRVTRTWHRWVLGLAVASLPVIVWLAWPNTIGYFNAFAGGTKGGHRILLDSNLDWNQDLWRLRRELEAQGMPPAMIALFGSVPVDVVEPRPFRIPTDDEVAAAGRPRALVIISKGILYSADLPFRWLRDIPPTKRIGSSVLMYDFR